MDLFRSMRVFRAVVEAESFARASKKLNISTAWVSKHVSELEKHLGAQLLRRTTRSLSLTESGQIYYRQCAEILDDVGRAEESVSALRDAPRGTLRVTAPMSFGILHLAPRLPEFSSRYPDVTLDLVLTDRVVDLIDEAFDVAVRIAAQLPDSRLAARKLFTGRRVLCAAPAYIAKRGAPSSLRALDEHDCLIYSLHATPHEWAFEAPDGALQKVHVNGCFIANNSIVIRAMLLAGSGIAIIPEFVVGDELRAGALVELLPTHRPIGATAHAVYAHSRQGSPKIRAFVDFLVERLADRPAERTEKKRRARG
ncbi:LysR substrate-binding domain-containing protein [Pendulispora albinea]|uniref:LysR substrate-binding domain-containing protein n=1 Tax=Pendulispora albinea TaxID=2741071 RepID=A0ABZ2LJ70_9BACT